MTKPLKTSDSLVIKDVLERVIQMRVQITGIFQSVDAARTVSDLPDSMIPTDLLLQILVTYEAMYDRLVTDKLIKTGSPKPNSTKTIH